jgi:hypothetical protein
MIEFPPAQVERFGRILNPVREAALREAVRLVRRGDLSMAERADAAGAALAIAIQFEGYLSGEQEGVTDD